MAAHHKNIKKLARYQALSRVTKRYHALPSGYWTPARVACVADLSALTIWCIGYTAGCTTSGASLAPDVVLLLGKVC